MTSTRHSQTKGNICLTKRIRCVCFVIVVTFIVHIVAIGGFVLSYQLRRETLKDFKERLTRDEKVLMMDTINAFSSALNRAQIPFFMYGGTLIGSWRHLGLVPWDDDADFIVPCNLKKEIKLILGKLQPVFILNEQGHRWKFFHHKATKIGNADWRFPFLDISFYQLNETHVWDEDVFNFNTFIFPKDVVFPLTFRLFEGRRLPSPNNAKAMLAHNYDLNTCTTGYYDHRLEQFRSSSDITCVALYTIYPFVHRVPVANDTCNETLLFNGQVLNWTVVDNETC